MAKAVTTPGQRFFTFGLQPRTELFSDSTRLVVTSAANQFVAGFPICMDATSADQGKIKSAIPTASDGDLFYGASGTNINNELGRTSLGEFEARRAVAKLHGIFTISPSVFLDASGSEVTINPFGDGTSSNGLPVATDVGKALYVQLVTPTAGEQAALGLPATPSILKWVLTAPVATSATFTTVSGGTTLAVVATVLDVREDSEVDVMLTNVLAFSNGSL
jgi:hypothetical protein